MKAYLQKLIGSYSWNLALCTAVQPVPGLWAGSRSLLCVFGSEEPQRLPK